MEIRPLSSDNGDSSEAEQGRSSTSKQSRWSHLDEQRLVAYKKEGRSWSWTFRKFPSRTERPIPLPVIPIDPKGYNWKEAGKLLGPCLYWTIGGPDAAPSSIPDIIRIWQGSWMGYLSLD
jgi:hypothetical protein